MSACRSRAGVTLIELACTIAIIAIVSSIVTIAARRMAPVRSDDPRTVIAAARERALEEGQAVSTYVHVGGDDTRVTAFADGSVVADSVVPVERFSGVFRDSSKR